MMTKTMISARVDEELNNQLEKLALASRRSKAFVIKEALENHIEYQTRLARKIEASIKEADVYF